MYDPLRGSNMDALAIEQTKKGAFVGALFTFSLWLWSHAEDVITRIHVNHFTRDTT